VEGRPFPVYPICNFSFLLLKKLICKYLEALLLHIKHKIWELAHSQHVVRLLCEFFSILDYFLMLLFHIVVAIAII
jgi:hypothetical protein